MSWVAITKAELWEAKVAALIEACDAAALGSGQAARSAGIIQGVINEVRNAVATFDGNQVDAALETIPQSLRDLTVDLVIARLKGALEIPLTDDERDTVSWRRKQLQAIAAGDLVVDQPDTAVVPGVQGGGGVTVVRPGATTNPFSGMGTT